MVETMSVCEWSVSTKSEKEREKERVKRGGMCVSVCEER